MSIILDHLAKRYDNQVVVNDVSLEIEDGEFFVLLGTSGSGKSTILRMIAGLTEVDAGRIHLHGKEVTHKSPQERSTGFVFQNYSIFRHMTVAKNIEFGLKIRHVSPAERSRKCDELLDLVGMTGFGDRYSHQISGGQQQRVALARALAYEPSVLLLDEPLGALDVKIRTQLRRSLKEIQQRLKLTTILVTHDQEEAFSVGDRIGVLDRGVLLEVGPSEQLYSNPKTIFVASFLGGGTILAGRVQDQMGRFGSLSIPIPDETPHDEGSSVVMVVRPEQVELSRDQPGSGAVLGKGSIIEQSFSGAHRRLRLRVPGQSGTHQIAPAVPFGEAGLIVEAAVPAQATHNDGEYWVRFSGWKVVRQEATRILVVDNGAESKMALHVASGIAERVHSSVVVIPWKSAVSPECDQEFWKRRLAAAHLSQAELRMRHGSLSEQIQGERSGVLFDLLIVPRNLGGESKELGPEIISCVERGDLPLLIVSEGAANRIEKIVICTRAGEPGKSDVRFGGRLARQLNATVTLLHITPNDAVERSAVTRHLQQAEAALKVLDVSATNLVRSGDPLEEIVIEEAQHDLVVVGGHGPQARSILATDDLTLRVLHGANHHVLVVPADETYA